MKFYFDNSTAAYAFALLTAIAGCIVVTWPPYKEHTLKGSQYIWNHNSKGWGESTHAEPMWRFTYATELAVYLIVGLQYEVNVAAALGTHLANFALIVIMYLRATEAQADSLELHNAVSPQTVVTLCVLFLNFTSIIQLVGTDSLKSKTP